MKDNEKNRSTRKWDILILVFGILVLASAFLNFITIRLPLDNELLRAALEKLGAGDGKIGFSVYQMIRGISSVEYGWSLLGMDAGDMRTLMVWILIPYVLALFGMILVLIPGRGKYLAVSGVSLLAAGCMVFVMIIRLPVLLSGYVSGLLDGSSVKLIEVMLGETIQVFFQDHILQYLREGFWCCVIVLGIICLFSLFLYVLSGRKRSRDYY